jgi:cytochrome c-type biogenesis protein CcmH/NrfG
LWFDCARALHAAGDPQQAIPALEACLRVDAQHVEGWFMMVDLAAAIGADEIANEAREVARALAPDDPRLNAA